MNSVALTLCIVCVHKQFILSVGAFAFSTGQDEFQRSYELLCTATTTAWVPTRFSKEGALEILDTKLLPRDEYGERIRYGRDAQGIKNLVAADDPKLSLTYGEFPTQSTDLLLDLALPYVTNSEEAIEMLDLGSGCGRLAIYLTLSRGNDHAPWHLHGIEISELLHTVASKAVTLGLQDNLLKLLPNEGCGGGLRLSHPNNTLTLYHGAAQDLKDILGKVHLIFAYSTVWKTCGFSEESGAMILGQEWSDMLASACRKGCVVITTDRALDPRYGWELVRRLDVDNREVMGSTGYIQILR